MRTGGSAVHGDVQRDHAALYATISREEPELSSRVAKLRANDNELLLVDFGGVQLSLKRLLDRPQSVEQDEAKAKLLSAEVVKQALAFVIMRTHPRDGDCHLVQRILQSRQRIW